MFDKANMPASFPEHVVSANVAQREWTGVFLNVANFQCNGKVTHPLPYRDRTRLSVVLQECAGVCEPRFHPDKSCPVEHMPRHMHFAPADLEIWGHVKSARRVVDATLVFDFDVLAERMEMEFNADKIGVPQARFSNDKIWGLVKLLAEVVENPDPSIQLYGDGIITAVTSQLFAAPQHSDIKTGALAPWQLRRVVEYMENHFPDRIELETLAGLINLSQAHFSRAFKTSTGLAPYQWQLDARIRRAQTMIAHSNATLSEIAQATGFADTVHFGRTFRNIVGVSPGAWRTERRR